MQSRTKNTKKDENTPIYRGQRLFEPLQITIAIMDKRCPNCGVSTRDDLGLDLGYCNRKCYGGLCFNCGFSFGFERQARSD